MLFNRQPRDVTLNVKLLCDVCDRIENPECEKHNGCFEDIKIKVMGIPWARLNYIKSQSVSFDDQKRAHFDGSFYINECLKQMIVEAPWGKTDDMFLLQLDEPLGKELEGLVPSAYGEKSTAQDFSEIKKE